MAERTCVIEDCGKATEGARRYCSGHRHRRSRYGSHTGLPPTFLPANLTERPCRRCLTTKPVDCFGPNKAARDGRNRVCRDCKTTEARENRRAEPADARQRRLLIQRRSRVRIAYGDAGLAVDERIRTGEGCEVCGGHTTRMAIDHDHATNRVRGLLCSNCNTALGLAAESVDRLRALIDYLDRHST